MCDHFKADANEVLAATKDLNQHLNGSAKQEELKEDLLRKLSFQAFGNLAPMNAFIGGLAAQEAMKVVCAFCEHFSFGLLVLLSFTGFADCPVVLRHFQGSSCQLCSGCTLMP